MNNNKCNLRSRRCDIEINGWSLVDWKIVPLMPYMEMVGD
jgi:hypothetical protein